MQWAKNQQQDAEKPLLWPSLIDNAFDVAIADNDYTTIETLLSKKIKVTEQKASQLLLHVIENKKNNAFIPLLAKHAHADVNYAVNGKTLLIVAVEQNNIEHVHALLEAGAVVDRVVDHTKETALQVAMTRKYTHAEQLLREYGA
jgi:ankyrin repeat protein